MREGEPSRPSRPVPQPEYSLKGELTHHKRAISCLAFSPNGKLLASASSDRTIAIWDVATLKNVKILTGHTAGITQVSWDSQSLYIVSSSDDKTLRIWEVDTGMTLKVLREHHNCVFCCCFNREGNLVASGSFDETIKLWDTRTGDCVRTIIAHTDPVTSVNFSRDSTMIISSSFDGLIRYWDAASGICTTTIAAEGGAAVGGINLSPNGKYILVTYLDSIVKLHSVGAKSKVIKAYKGAKIEKFCISAGMTTAGGKLAVSGSEDHNICVWDIHSGQLVQVWPGHDDPVLALATHPTKRIIASGGLDKDPSIKLWEWAE